MKNTVSCLGVAACVVLAMASLTHAGVFHEATTTPESAYLDYADTFPFVGWLFAGTQREAFEKFSSGVLVDPHWVLTSAHGVLANNENSSTVFSDFYFGLGPDIYTDPGERQFATEAFLHPDYRGFEDGPDLALIYFEDAFQSAAAAELYLGDVADLSGSDTSITGYGISGTPSTGYDDVSGIKRAGVVPVDSVGSTFMEAFFRQPGHPDFDSLGILGAPGDSGGGWFTEIGGEFFLTGISSLATLNPRYGSSTYATVLGHELDWINDTIASHGIPEPATAALLLVAASFCCWRRRAVAAVACLAAFAWLPAQSAQAALMHNASTTPESAYLEFADLYPSVGWLVAQDATETQVKRSSGVLTDSGDWGSLVATSAHGTLSNNADPGSILASVQFGLGPNLFSDPGENYFADEVFIASGYINVENGPDLALLYFDEQFVSAAPSEIYSGALAVGDVVDMVGYGTPGTPATGLQPYDGQRRGGQDYIEGVNTPSAGYVTTELDRPGFAGFSPLGIQGTQGDSGGGWFKDGMLAALYTDANTPRYGGDTTAYLVSLQLDWINATIASKQVPEPTSVALLLTGAPFVYCRRRRKEKTFGRFDEEQSTSFDCRQMMILSISSRLTASHVRS